MEQTITAIDGDINATIPTCGDNLKRLICDVSRPSVELIDERPLRQKTIQAILDGTEWFTAETVNGLQTSTPGNKLFSADEWKLRRRIFSVVFYGKELLAKYQFDKTFCAG